MLASRTFSMLPFALLSLFLPAQSAPTSAAASVPFSKACRNIELRTGYWLVAECPNSDGKYIQSSVWLPGKISKADDTPTKGYKGSMWLEWSNVGRLDNFCDKCRLDTTGAKLTCYCNAYSLTSRDLTINLEEHIGVYSGHLLSNQNGTPRVPADSSVPVPKSMSYNLFSSNLSCVNCGDGITTPWRTTCDAILGLDGQPSTQTGPTINCSYSHKNIVTTPMGAVGFNPDVDGAWEVSLFDYVYSAWDNVGDASKICAGQPFAKLRTGDGKCQGLDGGKEAIGYRVMPLWNADV